MYSSARRNYAETLMRSRLVSGWLQNYVDKLLARKLTVMRSPQLETREYTSINAILELTRKKIPAIPTESDDEERADVDTVPPYKNWASAAENWTPDSPRPTDSISTPHCPTQHLEEYMERAHKGFLRHQAWVHAVVSLALQLQAARNGLRCAQSGALHSRDLDHAEETSDGIESMVSSSATLQAEAATLHAELLLHNIRMEAFRQEMKRLPTDSGDILLQEIASSALPPADSLWSDDEI